MQPKFLLIDLFCGAGGTTTGAEKSGVCKVIAAINHDPIAIASHSANHGEVLHMQEDILLADTAPIKAAITYWKQEYPEASVILWASLECTNFSKAKGGLPRDADSRTLAHGLFRYIDELNPDYILIENVREFMAWGDLDENGRPVSKTNGREYIRWIKRVQSYGYNHQWRMLNAADFGGVTIRERYFGAFWKPDLHFSWPTPTHVKKPSKNGLMFAESLKPWRPVSEIIDFTDLGRSIFDRSTPLVDRTIKRILFGLKKFHKSNQMPSMIMTYNTPGYLQSVEKPVGAITTKGSKSLVTPFIQSYYSGSDGCSSTNDPCPTIPTKDRHALVSPLNWIDRDFISGRSSSIQQPAGALLTVPKMNLCSAFILNPQHTNVGSSIDSPSPTIVASRRYMSLVSTINHELKNCEINPRDSAVMVELKKFMRSNNIADIYMRMLKVIELKRIQGFPDDYHLAGTVEHQKKQIGNSVETGVVAQWLRAIAFNQ